MIMDTGCYPINLVNIQVTYPFTFTTLTFGVQSVVHGGLSNPCYQEGKMLRVKMLKRLALQKNQLFFSYISRGQQNVSCRISYNALSRLDEYRNSILKIFFVSSKQCTLDLSSLSFDLVSASSRDAQCFCFGLLKTLQS